MKVDDILSGKGTAVLTVRPTESIQTFAHRLRMERVGALVASEDGRRLDGIISERDLARGIAEHGVRCLELAVADLMTRRVVTCARTDSLAAVARMMTANRIRHLPVLEGRQLVGLVSIGDVVRHRFEEMEAEASVLRDMAVMAH
jgi:CBS domain-containing protein